MTSAEESPGLGCGFMPACPTAPERPKGAPTGRPCKARALEMDEALNMTGSLKGKLEGASARQKAATQRLRDNKSNAQQLSDKVQTMEKELSIARSEAEKRKVDPEVRTRFEKLTGDHATLQATHAWTKSSLDSTLAAQEEYRKGYTSLQAAFRKTKSEYEEKQKQIEANRLAREEASRVMGALPQQEAEFKQDLADSQECLKNIMNRQKKKSQAVLDKMSAGQATGLLQITLTSWQKAISDEKFWRENAKSLEEAQQKLKDFQSKKKEEASKVLDRMSAGNDTALCGIMIQYWCKYLQETKKEREEAKKMQDQMKNAKLSARKTLEQNLAGSATGILTSVMKAWMAYFKECKKVNELKGQAEAKLKEYQAKKKGEQASVIERMAGEQTQALMTRMFLCWTMTCLDESTQRHAHNDLTNQVDDLEAQLKALKESIAKTEEELEDTSEEITESRRKNAMLREEFKNIMELQNDMHKSMQEMDM